MPNLYGATGSRTAQGRPGSTSIDVPVLVDKHGRVITVPGAFAQSPSGLVRPRADNDGTQYVNVLSSGLVVTALVQIPGIAAATALDAGDAMGTKEMFSEDRHGKPLPQRGIIIGAKLIDRDDDTLSATMHIFSANFTGTANNLALAISAADAENWVTSMGFDDGVDIGSAKVHEITAWNSPYYSPTQRLYWQFSTAGTPNIAANLMPLVQLYILPFMEP